MSIRQQIAFGFIVAVTLLLLLFSGIVYGVFTRYRTSLIYDRLERRAQALRLFPRDPAGFRGTTVLTLTEQYEAIYDDQDSLIYALAPTSDYVPSSEFLQNVRQQNEVRFSYPTRHWQAPKEGVALGFRYNRQNYVALVTAYDVQGHHNEDNLLYILLIGNGVLFGLVIVVAHRFARRIIRPFDRLICQLEGATEGGVTFRLTQPQPAPGRQPDEVGQLANAFNQLMERMQKLTDSQKHFVSYASHELRTPLTVVKGQLETALAQDELVPASRHNIEIALKHLDHTIGLAGALLRLAEVEGMNATPARQDVNIVDLVTDTVDIMARKYPLQSIDVTIYPAFLKKSPEVRLIGIPYLLRTALVNVTDNACKYSNDQPVEIRVDYVNRRPDADPEPTEHTGDGLVEISIVDRGIGIPAAALPNVTLPMVRADNVGPVDGFGLGLTLASKIVDIHQGRLLIESTLSEGTVVRLQLPVKGAERDKGATSRRHGFSTVTPTR